ncbi:ribosomal protein L7/L12 [Nakamurella lactea]|uniref:ribosomal protein L7/L12 n=1 Tax=Nakamurella lactea TaxID=459515 RepID=UPI000566BA5A|nr:ribosomal protein L7/L12 [Nakamurella lactea]
MDAWLWVVVAVLLVVLVVVLARRTAVGRVDPTQLLLDPTLMAQVRSLAESGQKVQAIATLRSGTPGLGLAAAKAIVDRMTSPAAAPAVPQTKTQGVPAVPPDIAAQVLLLKSQGEQIAAIKLVREHTGCGLREAKDYVDGV